MASRKTHIAIFSLSLSLLAHATTGLAQITVRSNSGVHARGQLTTNSSISNTGSTTDLAGVELILRGGTQQLSTTSPLRIKDLTIDQGSTKTLVGNWEVTGTLSLISGVVTIGNNGKLLYSGTARPEGNSNAYINGLFFHNQGGQLFFPIGTRTVYAPAMIEHAPTGEVGMQALSAASEIPFTLPADITDAYFDHYWQLSNVVSSPVALSTNGLDTFLEAAVPVVLQGEATGGALTSLSGSVANGFITSSESASQPVLIIGKAAEFQLVIHDLITPYHVNVNDRLTIDNIEKTEHNTVRLLDRWGLTVAEWKDFTNDTEYDFTRLSPGNYVCIVEFSYPGQAKTTTAKGMVTVLKSN